MQLLVSVANDADAAQAIAGGADWIDAKDPAAGPLGRVTLSQLRRICRAAGPQRAVSAALGDLDDPIEIERLSTEYSQPGPSLLKIGLGHVATASAVTRLAATAVNAVERRTSSPTAIVAVAYADEGTWAGEPNLFVASAAAGGASGVLLDTARKDGPGLCALLPLALIRDWVSAAHEAGLSMAVAGRLTADDLPRLASCGADVAGVRGAACTGGRRGPVTAEQVMTLRAACLQPDLQAR